MPRPTGELERGLAELTIDHERDRRRLIRSDTDSGAHELLQQVRVPIGGTVGGAWSFFDQGIGFLTPFVWAPAQRDAPFETPHFSHGVEHIVGTDALIIVHASVLSWKIDDQLRTTGCKMRFAAMTPELAVGSIEFSAEVHLTFQGWGGDLDEGD